MIITGYIIGLCSLFIITYRTFIAFFSENKAIIIYINRFGEQFIDLFAIIIIWTISLTGLLYLFRYPKKEPLSKEINYELDKNLLDSQQILDSDVK